MHRKLLSLVILVLAYATIGHAQGTPYQLDPPAPNAILRACSFPVTGGNPCSNPATIYSDSALTQVIAQPVQLGDSGNLIFYYSSGPLMLQLTGSVNRSILVAGGGGGGTPGGASHDIQCNVSSAFAPCGSASGAFTSTTVTGGALITHSENGSFVNGVNNAYNVFGLNSCDRNVAITAYYTANGIATDTLTDSVAGCINLPSGTGLVTNVENAAVSGYAINNNSSQQNPFCAGCNAYGIGVRGMAYAAANNTTVEGLVGEVVDKAGTSGQVLLGTEVGVGITNASTTGFGFLFSPFGGAQPAYDTFPAFDVHNGTPGTLATSGFRCEKASVLIHDTNFEDCMALYPISSSADAPSASAHFESLSNTSTPLDGFLVQLPDGAGTAPRLTFETKSGNASGMSFSALLAAGYSASISGCSTSSTHLGGMNGNFTSGTTGTCTVTLTFPITSFAGWSCSMQDVTHAAPLNETSTTTTTAVFSGTTTSGDVIVYSGCGGF